LPFVTFSQEECRLFTIAKYGINQEPFNGWMDKENVVYIHNRVLSSHKEESHSVTYSKMDVTGEHYVKASTTYSLSYAEGKTKQKRQPECRIGISRGWEGVLGEDGQR
jgi:hypothetical protein